MSSAEEKIAQLEAELRVAQELLYLVVDKVGDPVVLNIEESRERMKQERALDLTLDEEEGTWIIRIVEIE